MHVMENNKESKDGKDGMDAMPVACFSAPGAIKVLNCAVDEITVGCTNGDALHLHAAFLAQKAASQVLEGGSGHKEPQVDRNRNK